jgi:hypothetical protein
VERKKRGKMDKENREQRNTKTEKGRNVKFEEKGTEDKKGD